MYIHEVTGALKKNDNQIIKQTIHIFMKKFMLNRLNKSSHFCNFLQETLQLVFVILPYWVHTIYRYYAIKA